MIRSSRRRPLFSAVAALTTLAFVAGACGDDSGDDDAGGSPAATEAPAGGESGSEATDAPAPEGGVITIGNVAPLTAFLAEYGAHQVSGVELAVKQVNDSGGLNVGGAQYTVEITTYDDQCEPTEAVSAMTRVIEQGVVGVIGSVCSSNTLAMRDVADDEEIVLITPGSTAPNITEPGHPYMFRTLGHIGLMAEQVIPYGVETLGIEKFAFLSVNNDFGRSAVDFYGAKMTELGAELITPEFYEAGTVDFYTTIEKVMADNPDGLFIAGGAVEGAAIMRQFDELGYLDQLTVLQHGLNTQEFAELAGEELIEGCCFGAAGFVFDELADETKTFVQENAAAFGEPANEVVVYSYDAAMALMRAIEIAGTVDDHAAIRDALAGLTVEDYRPLNNVITAEGDRIFDDVGQLTPEYVITHWVAGESVPVED
jgi:branched-chain amino acid transport system substrate-binding protein